MNPGFSSTRGVQIAMTRFNETRVNSMTRTVDVGAGLIWDQVYETLEPTGLNVVGGRIPNVGVAGLTLGGGECLLLSENSISYALGYSFLSNQYGLTVDTVARFELVLPNGTVSNVTSEDDDLWFGLRVSRQAQL
jgi:FAD/FMN-containing dehydrogenase